MKTKTILKLKTVVYNGHVPSRDEQCYSSITLPDGQAYTLVNCVGHSFFNLSNEQLKDIEFDLSDSDNIGCFYTFFQNNPVNTKAKIFNFVRRTGLRIRPYKGGVLKNNEWIVAYYFRKQNINERGWGIHFMLREKDGSWSSKEGYTETVLRFPDLSKRYGDYTLVGTYKITNPHAEKHTKNKERSK